MSKEESFDPVIRFEAMLKNDTPIFFDVEELGVIIHYYIENHQIVLAEKALGLAKKQYPDSLEIIAFSIEIDLAKDEFEKAKEKISSLKKQDFDPIHLGVLSAVIASKSGDHYRSISHYKHVLKLLNKETDTDEEAQDIKISLANEYTLVGEYLSALEIYEEALINDSSDSYALYEFIYLCKKTSNQLKMIAVLDFLTGEQPYNENIWYQLGKALEKTGQLKKAISCYEYAVVVNKDFVEPLIKKADLYVKEAKHTKALRIYTEALEIDPKFNKTVFKLTKCCLLLGWSDQAVEFYQAYLEYEKTDDLAYYKYAKLCFQLGMDLEAFGSIISAIAIYPKDKRYYKLLAKLLDSLANKGSLKQILKEYFGSFEKKEPNKDNPFAFIVDYLTFASFSKESKQFLVESSKYMSDCQWFLDRKKIISTKSSTDIGGSGLMKKIYLKSFVDLFIKNIKHSEG